MNLNESLTVELVKTEALDVDDGQLQLLQREVLIFKSEQVSNTDEYKSASINTRELKVISHQTLELGHVKSDEDIFIKKELLHEELHIKSEDKTTFLDDKDNLQIQSHKRTTVASREKLLKWNLCESSYRWNCHLLRHLRTHSEEKPFKCTICSYSCREKFDLMKHSRTHTGDKPFKCKLCDSGFGMKSILTEHLKIRPGDKPYKCNFCDSSFSKKYVLKTHLVSHIGMKTFKSNICDSRFRYKFSLNTHLITHIGE